MGNPEYPDLPFVRPRAWGKGRDGRSVQVIVVHYTAGSERSTSAEDGAAYDTRRTDGTSTHYFVDQNSIVQCVETWNRANAALHNGNRIGIQYELCGTVQTREQWLDPASRATIALAARQIARDCVKYGIPVRKLSAGEVRAGVKGICGHVDITYAFPQDRGNHTDPGTAFPWDVLLADVAGFISGVPPANVPPATPVVDRPLVVDGELGPATVRRWQSIMGTPADGVISRPSSLVKAVQRHLNTKAGAGLVVDGDGIRQDGRVYRTARALQRYLGTPQDGVISAPVSAVVKALQRRLNAGWF